MLSLRPRALLSRAGEFRPGWKRPGLLFLLFKDPAPAPFISNMSARYARRSLSETLADERAEKRARAAREHAAAGIDAMVRAHAEHVPLSAAAHTAAVDELAADLLARIDARS